MNHTTPQRPVPAQADPLHAPRPWIYLCGSFHSDQEKDWRSQFVRHLEPYAGTILNPYIKPYPELEYGRPEFNAQAAWEFYAAERADLVVVAIVRGSQGLVSLLELGRLLNAPTGDILVYVHKAHPAYAHVRYALAEHDVYCAPDMADLLGKTCYWVEARRDDRWLRSRSDLLRET